MSNIHRVGDLEIGEDIDYQRRSWMVQRIAWGGMGLVALAALLGLFGTGPLSKVKAGNDSDPIQLEYDRFGRFQAAMQMRIELQPSTESSGQARIWLNSNYLEKVQIQNVVPPPESVEVDSERLTYVFRTGQLYQKTAVTFYLQPEQIGSLSGKVGLGEKQPIEFSQFIYP